MLFLLLFLSGSGSVITISIPVLIISLIGLICILTAIGIPAAVCTACVLLCGTLRHILPCILLPCALLPAACVLSRISILPASGILRAAVMLRTAVLLR